MSKSKKNRAKFAPRKDNDYQMDNPIVDDVVMNHDKVEDVGSASEETCLPEQPSVKRRSFTVVCDIALSDKVKTIATQEGLKINSVVEAMLTEGIRMYEKVHGEIDAVQPKRSAAEVLFGV